MPHILHINDNNLLVQSSAEDGGALLERSQGYAWLNGEKVSFDLSSAQSPVSQCRVAPQEINSRYWQQCAQTAIPANGAGMRHAADLIWKHLTELKAKLGFEKLALVVPANYRDEHLQLLLGVAKANALEVSALISKPVLAAKYAKLPIGEAWHIDVQLHQTVISKLMVSDTEISLEDIEVKADLGLYSLQESLLHTLQTTFIRADRFDPLHNAGTEQQLFDQLSEIVSAAGAGQKVNVGVQLNSKLYHATAEPKEIHTALASITSLIDQYSSKPLIVDTNAEFDLSNFVTAGEHAISWSGTPEPLSNQLLINSNENGKVIYQTSLSVEHDGQLGSAKSEYSVSKPLTSKPLTSKPLRSESAVSQESHKALSDELPSATHLMQMGMIVPLNKTKISTQGARLFLTIGDEVSDVDAMLKAGDLQIVNDPQRLHLQANDRLMSPLADGVITALTLVTDPAAELNAGAAVRT